MKKSKKLILVVSLFVGILAVSTVVLANNQNPVQTEQTATTHHKKDGDKCKKGKCDHKGCCADKEKCKDKKGCTDKEKCKDKKEGKCEHKKSKEKK